MNYTYNIRQDENGNIIVEIYNDNELVMIQDVNPNTGQKIQSEDEALLVAQQLIADLFMNEAVNNPPKLRVSFVDNEGNPAKIIKKGEPVNVKVELYYGDDESGIVYAPISGSYVVPYFDKYSGTQVGAVVIDIENGQGSGQITIDRSGIFTIKLDKVLNAETMEPPHPLPVLQSDPTLAVVD